MDYRLILDTDGRMKVIPPDSPIPEDAVDLGLVTEQWALEKGFASLGTPHARNAYDELGRQVCCG